METQIILPDERYQRKLFIVAGLAHGIPAAVILILTLSIMAAKGIGLASRTAIIFYSVFGVSSLALWIILVATIPSYFRSISYELTDNEVIVRKGIFTKAVKTIPFHKITNLVETRDLIDRFVVGLGNIKIQTAGRSGETGYEACLAGLADWHGVHEQIVSRLRPGLGLGQGSSGETGETIVGLLREILEEVRSLRGMLERR